MLMLAALDMQFFECMKAIAANTGIISLETRLYAVGNKTDGSGKVHQLKATVTVML